MNPFQPPAEDSPHHARSGRRGGRYFVDGQLLIAEKGAALPDLCLYNGQPTRDARVNKELVWATPAIAVLVVISPLIYLIVYFIVRKKAALEYSLSEEARGRRTSGIVIALGGFVLSFILIGAAASEDVPLLIPGAVLLMLVTLIVGLVRSRVINIVKIDQTHVHLKLRPETAQAFAAATDR
jgi:uncharacterized membrane protein (DUF485 family)